jgi:hypothetical protein
MVSDGNFNSSIPSFLSGLHCPAKLLRDYMQTKTDAKDRFSKMNIFMRHSGTGDVRPSAKDNSLTSVTDLADRSGIWYQFCIDIQVPKGSQDKMIELTMIIDHI